MPPADAAPAIRGLDDRAIDAAVAALGDEGTPAAARHRALEAFRALPAPGPAVGRYWKIDIAKLDLDRVAILPESAAARQPAAKGPRTQRGPGEAARFEQVDARVAGIDVDPALLEKGLVVCDIATALREYPALTAQAAGSAVDPQSRKYAALNAAFRYGGAFVLVPKGASIEQPIVLRYRAAESAVFPYTLVVASEGARATIVSHVEGGDFEGAFVSEIVEVVVGSGAQIDFAAAQRLGDTARVFSTKRATIARDGQVHWQIAELGAELSVSEVHSEIDQPGVRTSISGIFFAAGGQHVDVESEVDHRIGGTSSETLFKSAATGRGQARYLGNILIRPHAHGTEATLRDDALLLSKTAHIDSIPALEIAANDVKAYHGATVGAIGADEVFYAMSRGIDRREAERMIALGFFEPAIARFPTESLKEELRDAIAGKLA